MRPALIRAGALFASLLALTLVLVPVAQAAGGEEVQREIEIRTHVGGFSVTILSADNDGKPNVLLYVSRGRELAEYFVPAEVTDSTVKARFPGLGELDYSFRPKGSGGAECFGAGGDPAVFTGAFTFTGENGFVHIDLPRAAGEFKVYPAPSACPLPRLDRASPTPRDVPYEPYVGKGATLTAIAGSGRTRARTVAVSRGENDKRGTVSGFLTETAGAMTIVRGAVLVAGVSAFDWDLAAGTATVRPPVPFTGTAHFARRPGGRALWTGSLRVPILGGKPIRLAGGAFHAALHRGVPHDD
jgi:hypothetical protein